MTVFHQHSFSWRKALSLFSLALPFISYALLLVWVMAQRKWAYLFFIVPSALMSLTSILTSLAQSSPTTAQNAAQETLPTDYEARKNHEQLLLSAVEHTSISCEKAPTWQKIVHQWLSPVSAVRLGSFIDNGKETAVQLDIFSHGPHALIAGTTGSGKSVLLETWALELASHIPPDQLHFVFLDFKGGATFVKLRNLPHTVGNVSNLNENHAKRAIRGLLAEMTRREKLLAQAQVSDISQLKNPPARIVIMADEFFILASQLPDYVHNFSTLITLGRSLGMHCIICTQNPMNQVNSHIKANMPVHMCLRVTDPMQSVDMLSSAIASTIPTSLIGACFIDDGEKLQSMRVWKISDTSQSVHNIEKAGRFMMLPHSPLLFSAPLPQRLTLQPLNDASPDTDISSVQQRRSICCAMTDTGITIEPWTIELARTSSQCVVLIGMSEADALANLSSIASSLRRSGLTQHTSHNGNAKAVIITSPVNATSLEKLLTFDGLTIFCTCNSWSRLRTTLSDTARVRSENAILVQSLKQARIMPEFGYILSDKTKEIMDEYSDECPARAIALSDANQLIQFFENNFDETLEKNSILWFS